MLESLPGPVKKKYGELKATMGFPLSLKRISGHYYLYKMIFTKEGKKTKTSTEYLGTIKANGIFVAKGMTTIEKETATAVALLESQGAEIKWPKKAVVAIPGATDEELKILNILSMNGRARMGSIGKLLGITPQAAGRKVRDLEKRYGIGYTTEIDPIKLGYLEYLVFIKFEGEKPSARELVDTFGPIPTVQLCATLKGEYDVLLYVLVNIDNVRTELENLRFNTLTKFTAIWYINSVTAFYGFVPIRDVFFNLLKDRVWHRKRGQRELPRYALFQRDYYVLRSLNSAGKKNFNEIDTENKLPNGSARYAYHRLLESGILRRITIGERNLPVAYDAILQFRLVNANTYQPTRNSYRLDVIKLTKVPYTEYSVIFDSYNPDGFIAIISIRNGSSIEEKESVLRSMLEGIKLDSIVITGVLIGDVCHRRFDNVYSVQYESLLQQKVIEPLEKVQYEKL